MGELINLFFSSDNLFTGFIVAIITFLFTLNINKNKTTTDTFKKEGITVQERLLDFWSGVLIFGTKQSFENYRSKANLNKKLSQSEIFEYIQSETVRYSSKNTLRALATYQQYVYKDKSEKIIDYELIVLALRVAKSMKYDFTGEKMSVLDLMEIKIKDMKLIGYLMTYFYLVFYYIYDKIPLLLFITLIVKLFEIMY